jgi:hypothetical protein
MGLLTLILRPSGPTHDGPLFLLSKSIRCGTHGTKPRQEPPSAWQVSFGFENSNLPLLQVATDSRTKSIKEFIRESI